MTVSDVLLLLLLLTAIAGVASYWIGHRQRLQLLRTQHQAAVAAQQAELRQANQHLLASIQQAQHLADTHATAAAQRNTTLQQAWDQQLTSLRQELAAQHTATQQRLAQLETTLRETVDLNL